MTGTSAHGAKRTAPKRKPDVRAETVYTINGTQYTLAQVEALVQAYDSTSAVSRKMLRARLERGHRDLKSLAADKLGAYRPLAYRATKK